MKQKQLQLLATVLSCVCILISSEAASAAPIAAMSSDIELRSGGVLLGQIVDAQGVAVVLAPVLITNGIQEVARAQTDEQGNFAVSGLRGGVYKIASAGHQGVYRLWSPQTAPPSASQGLMVVVPSDVVRGQCGCGVPGCGTACGAVGGGRCCGGGGCHGMGNWIANHPLVTAGAIGAGIAIPLAVSDDNSTLPAEP